MRKFLMAMVMVWAAAMPLMANEVVTLPLTSADEAVPHELVGEGRLKWLFFDVYDARLSAPRGIWRAHGPFTLELSYLRAFKGRDIVNVSLGEMRRLGMANEMKLREWERRMLKIFPDVAPGMTIAGERLADGSVRFVLNDERELGRMDDPAFASVFFGIWLHADSRVPELRRKLLNM